MKIKKIVTPALYILLASLCSCSQKSTIPVLSNNIPVQLQHNIDPLIPIPEIDLSFFKTEPVKFITQKTNITETFTSFEKNQVRVKDEKLFAKYKDLIINFDQLSEEEFTFPLPGARVISPYGTRRGRSHTGIDIKTFANDSVRAAFDGIVRVSNRGRGYGNVIVVRHYNGLETVYSHNSKNLVSSGDRVTSGTAIALMGRTGRATTEHVHFETRINGEHFDPNIIIDFEHQTLKHKRMVFTPGEKGSVSVNSI